MHMTYFRNFFTFLSSASGWIYDSSLLLHFYNLLPYKHYPSLIDQIPSKAKMICENILLLLSWLVALWQDPRTPSAALISLREDEPFWSFCFLDGSTYTSSFAPPPPTSIAARVFLSCAALYKTLFDFLAELAGPTAILFAVFIFVNVVCWKAFSKTDDSHILALLGSLRNECGLLRVLSIIIEKGAEDIQTVKLSLSAVKAENRALKAQKSQQPLRGPETEKLVAGMQTQRLKDLEEGYKILHAKYTAAVSELEDARYKSIKTAAKHRGGRGRKKQNDNASQSSEGNLEANKA
jgi:hypothetical protein